MKNICYHIATKVVLLFIRLKIRLKIEFSKTLFLPYFPNKTTLVAEKYYPTFQPYYLIFKQINIIQLNYLNKIKK